MNLSKSIQIFYKNIIESSPDEESGDDSELMMVAAMLLNKHCPRPVHRARQGTCG
jgi:hypothetical protein